MSCYSRLCIGIGLVLWSSQAMAITPLTTTASSSNKGNINAEFAKANANFAEHEAKINTLQTGKQDALGYIPEDASKKGVSGGYAGLDAEGKVPVVQLPESLGTDDQAITDFSLSGTVLSLTLENGNTVTLDIAAIQDGTGTDDQTITNLSLSGNTLSITLEDGNTATVDLTALAGTGGVTSYNDLDDKPILGTAAALDAGTRPGNLVQLGAACTVGDGAYTDESTCTTNGGQWVGVLAVICDPDTESCDTKLDILSAHEIDQRIATAGGGGSATISTSQPSGGSPGDVWYVVQ